MQLLTFGYGETNYLFTGGFFTPESGSSLVVEDGTGVAAADSFCTLAEADAYHSGRNNVAWFGLSVYEKDVALRKAADYMEQQYRSRWDGWRTTLTQQLSWPRFEVRNFDSTFGYRWWPAYIGFNVVPQLVKNAQCELALRAISQQLSVDVGRLKKSVKVGPLAVEYVGGMDGQILFSAVENMLLPFFKMHAGRYTTAVSRA